MKTIFGIELDGRTHVGNFKSRTDFTLVDCEKAELDAEDLSPEERESVAVWFDKAFDRNRSRRVLAWRVAGAAAAASAAAAYFLA